MRYQENKTHAKTSKGSDNGGAENGKNIHRKQAVIVKGGSMSLNGNNSQENGLLSSKNRIHGGDLLSQWRQKKRSRKSVDDSARKSAPIAVHATGNGSDTSSKHPEFSVNKRNIPASLITRSFEDTPACERNGHMFDHREDKYSPTKFPLKYCDRSDKISPCNNGDCIARNSSPPSETQAFAQPHVERMNMDDLPWPRILISLSRKEKEDDFFIIKGSKLPQRPKKRPKVVEKNLQNCYPGFWLSDVARGRYDVREKKNTRKRPRGLKAMENTCSESD